MLIYASILSAAIGLSTSEASAMCQSEACNNGTLLFNQFSNSTLSFNQFSNSTMSFNQFSNSTGVAENGTLVLSEQLDINDIANANDTNSTSVPAALFQFLYNDTNNTQTGNAKNTTSNALQLQGDQYLTENSSSTNLKSLTISAWVKPDYSKGSPIFTVVSDENAFTLAVNNNMPPLKIATFSVFDGIKWTTVQSTSTILEQWTNLVATFNGSSIGIYVNGNLEGTSPIAGIPTLVDGDLRTKTVQNLTSNANITLGAYYEKVRMDTRNLFSGEISSVNLYGSVLTHDQIIQIYNNTKPEDSIAYSH